MNIESLLKKIKSKFILKNIFVYIKDDAFMLKLFVHSKFFQKLLELDYEYYKEKYKDKYKIIFDNINDYFCLHNYNVNISDKKYFLMKKLFFVLLKYQLKLKNVNKGIIDAAKKYINKLKLKNEEEEEIIKSKILIDIYSPFFDIISKSEIFEKYFTIYIPEWLNENNTFINDHILIFNKMNKLNIRYSSLIFNNNNIYYLLKFRINFKYVKSLYICLDEYKQVPLNFFDMLFSLHNIDKNLIYLKISGNNLKYKNKEIESNEFEKLNNLKLLKYLQINRFTLHTNFLLKFFLKNYFILKLYNLTELILIHCENMAFSEDNCYNCKKLQLSYCSLIEPNSLIKFPKLEELKLEYYKNEKQNYHSIIDFKSLQNLKILEARPCDFIHLQNTKLKRVKLKTDKDFDYENEKKMIKQIFSIKSLKEIVLCIGKISNNEISKIPGQNNSVSNLEIHWRNKNYNCRLYELIKKFLNLSYININTSVEEDLSDENKSILFYHEEYNNKIIRIKIKENKNCKINRICIKACSDKDIKLYCQSYESLIELNISVYIKIEKLKNTIPIFNDKCKIFFKALIYFSFIATWHETNLNVINNIYSNIDKMPNLLYFRLICINKDYKEESYKKFIQKILSIGLKEIELNISKNDFKDEKQYTENELKEVYPNINHKQYNYLFIRKFN